MNDVDFLRSVLADGKPHNLNEILRRSFDDRGCGLTTHSRAADLRRQLHAEGGDLLHWTDGKRGAGSWYRLVAGPLTAPPTHTDRDDLPGHLSVDGDGVDGAASGSQPPPLEANPHEAAAQLTLEVAA